jgi:hypothetical protein
MEKFSIFFERAKRNPLRTKELADRGYPNHKDWVEQELQRLSPEIDDEVKKMQDRGVVTPNEAERIRNLKQLAKKKELENKYLRGKSPKDMKRFEYNAKGEKFLFRGINVFIDDYALNYINERKKVLGDVKNTIKRSLMRWLLDYKDILPNRKPTIVISSSEKNPKFVKMKNIGKNDENASGYYNKRKIFIDIEHVSNYKILIHEYAHFLADIAPRELEPVIRNEYKQMLNSYFIKKDGKPTRRKSFEGAENEKLRRQVKKKLKLPDSYAVTNFHEWFAVLMENWKDLPNNKHTYKFKTMLKKILTRI